MPDTRDHGGNLFEAIARFGGVRADWLDLSTGINARSYPIPPLDPAAWSSLPDAEAERRLLAAARKTYAVPRDAGIVAAPGASVLIRLMPRLAQSAKVAITGPTYNEHAAAFLSEGWQVTDQPGPGVTAAVIVNPNNPDGRRWEVQDLLLLAEALDLLVVDESFMDPTPERSLIPYAGARGLVVLRSFGKFYGLAGIRLGFAVTGKTTAERLSELLGPWAISGPALEIGARALADETWREVERVRLRRDSARLIDLAARAGWRLVGGTDLFQTFEASDATEAQIKLAQHRIWSRIFPYSSTWIRLGVPFGDDSWSRLEEALT